MSFRSNNETTHTRQRAVRLLLATLLLVAPMLGPIACKKHEGPFEKAGKKIDKAVDDIADEAKDAADEVEDAVDGGGQQPPTASPSSGS